MKTLLSTSAAIEMGAGLALTIMPSTVVILLLGSSLHTPATLTVGRVAGIALFTLGVACCFARNDGGSRAAAGLVTAMLFYNVVVAGVLVFAGTVLELYGIALWPGVFLHAAMAVWCLLCLQINLKKVNK